MASQTIYELSIPGEFQSATRVSGRSRRSASYRAASLCAAVLILCGLALAYGHVVSSVGEAAQLGLARCGTKPCFRGMVPGETSWTEAKTVFNADPIVRLYASDGAIVLFPSLDGHSLGLISIIPTPDHTIGAGEIIMLYGPPNCVDLSLTTGNLILHYSLLDVNVESVSKGFNPHTPVRSIDLWDPASPYDDHSHLCSADRSDLSSLERDSIVRTWHGLASAQRYVTLR